MTPDRVVIRNRTGRTAFFGAFALSVVLIGDALLRGAFDVAAIGLAVLGAIVGGLYLVLVRPRVVVSTSEIMLVSPVRSRHVSWADVVDLRVTGSVAIELRDGRVARSWLATPDRADSSEVQRIQSLRSQSEA